MGYCPMQKSVRRMFGARIRRIKDEGGSGFRGMSIMKPALMLAVILAFGAVSAIAQNPTKGWEKSPNGIVDQVWRLATQGELLTPEGWDRVARGFFVHPVPALGTSVRLIRPSGD